MNTPSHWLVTAALRKCLGWPLPGSAVLWGSVAPDVPLIGLSLGGIAYYHGWLGWSQHETFRHLFDDLYFHHHIWIAAHHLLHAPTSLALGLIGLWRFRHPPHRRLRWLWWFLAACFLHSAIDILTHVDDGPLLFFPFDWSTRFASPVSYWDRNHYGAEFARFELVLDLICVLYLIVPRYWHRIAAGRRRPDRASSAGRACR